MPVGRLSVYAMLEPSSPVGCSATKHVSPRRWIGVFSSLLRRPIGRYDRSLALPLRKTLDKAALTATIILLRLCLICGSTGGG